MCIRDSVNPIDPNAYGERLSKTIAKATMLANQTLLEYREKMKQQVSKKTKTPGFKVNDIVNYSKPPEAYVKGLSRKLADRNLGPYLITRVDEKKGNVEIQIAPN